MHNLVPHFIQENFARGVSQGHFPAIGLFLDLTGFSKLSDILMEHGPHGAEVLAEVMRGLFAPLAEAISGQGGFIAKIAGDAFTALFPLTGSGIASAQRALAVACRIQQIMTADALTHTSYGNYQIQAKIGLAAGEARWGIVTSSDGRRAAYYFQGAAVEGCARAEHYAQAGEIVLDASILSQVSELAVFEPVEEYHRLARVTGELPTPQPVILPQPRAEIIARFYPENLVTQVSLGEFRQVVNLFINLPTVRNETQLSIFMNTIFGLQDRYDGLLNALDFGDKGSNLLMFWGAPITYENDIERALDFIIDLQTLTSIPINAGITYRIAHAGYIGSTLLEDFTCYGRGVNLAARFMTTAARGEIWVDEHIARRAKAHYDFEYTGEISFKGFAEKQKVYLLLERKEKAEPFYTGKMIGRHTELQRLETHLAPLWQGLYAGAMVILGEPGIGKSRLVHTLQTALENGPYPTLWAVCQTDQTLRTPFNPLRYWLRHYFEQSTTQNEARNKRSFNAKLEQLLEATIPVDTTLAEELDRTRTFLGAMIDLHWPDSLYEQLDPQGRYENTLLSLITLLQSECLRQPVILFLDDAQWLDADTRAFLPRLARTLTAPGNRPYPLAFLATARQETEGPLLGDGLSYHEILLSGLPAPDLVSLVENILRDHPSNSLLELVSARAEGNPFFAEQIIHYLQDQGLLVQSAAGWSTQDITNYSLLPGDIRTILVARLDRLSREVKAVVQNASILGREFEIQLLIQMLRDDPGVLRKVELATHFAIWTAIDQLHYIFKHILLRDAAYGMLILAHRQALHATAMQAIEQLYQADLNPHYGTLVYHSEQAGLLEKSCNYLRLAAEAARDAFQNHQAIDYYSRLLQLTPDDDLEARYTLLLEREALYNTLGERGPQAKDLDTLAKLAEQIDSQSAINQPGAHQAEILDRQASYVLVAGDYLRAADQAERAIRMAKSADALQIAVEAYNTLALAYYRQGKFEPALEMTEEGYRLATQIGYLHGQSQSLNTAGIVALEFKDPVIARGYLNQSLRMAQETGNKWVEAMSLNNLGNLAGAVGNLSEAQEYFERSVLLARSIGNRRGEGLLMGNLGWVSGMLGDYTAAQSYSQRSLQIHRELGHREGETITLINLSANATCQGRYLNGVSYANQALSLCQELGESSSEAWALTYLGHAHLGLGEIEAAETAYRDALQLRRKLSQPNLATEPLAGLAQVARLRGDIFAALSNVEMILTHLANEGTLDGTDQPFRVSLVCYQVLVLARDDRAVGILNDAYHQLQEQAEKITDTQMRRSFLGNVRYHREIVNAWESINGTEASEINTHPAAT